MEDQFLRTKLLIGEEGFKKLSVAKVAVFGIGGVGSYVVEALARAGIGNFVLIDKDVVSVTNINRQIHATLKTIGCPKVEVMKERILDINLDANVEIFNEFYLPDNAEKMIDKSYSYVVDAVDNVTAKIDLVVRANELKIPIISAMGAGNKLEPTKFEVSDIFKTSVYPLAKVMRRELKSRNIKKLKVVYSKEEPIKVEGGLENNGRSVVGSISFVPSVVGLIIASEVVKDLLKG